MARARKSAPTAHPEKQVRRHPRWGATPAQGRRYQRERDLANRVFELEQALGAAAGSFESSARILRLALASGKAKP